MADKEITIQVKALTEEAKAKMDELQEKMQGMGGGSADTPEQIPAPSTEPYEETAELIRQITSLLTELNKELRDHEYTARSAWRTEQADVRELMTLLDDLCSKYAATSAEVAKSESQRSWWDRLKETIGLSGKAAQDSKKQIADAADEVQSRFSRALTDLQGDIKGLQGPLAELTGGAAAAEKAVAQVVNEEKRSSIAAENAASLAEKRAAAEQLLQVRMKYSTMGVRALREELVRLNAERKAASAAGDTATYEKLTRDMGAARMALRAATQARNIDKAAMMGQAAAGMQLASTINSLSDSVSSGSTNIAGMTNQVMALTMAMKAGMGPIGWAMMALQLAQVAFQKFLDTKTEDFNRKLEEIQARTEALSAEYERLGDIAKLENTLDLEATSKALERVKEAGEEKLKAAEEAAAADEAAASRREQALKAEADHEHNMAKLRISTEVARGNMSKDKAKAAMQQADAEHERVMENLQIQAAERRAQAADVAAAFAGEAAKNLAMQLDGLKKLGGSWLEAKLPDERQVELLEKRLQGDLTDAERSKLQQEQENVMDMVGTLRKTMRALGISAEGGAAEVLAWGRKMQELVRNGDKMLNAASEKQSSMEKSAKAAAEEAEAARVAAQNKHEEAKAAEKAREAAEAKEAQEKAQAEYTRQVSKELAGISKRYAMTGRYQEDDQRTEKDIRDCDRTILEAKERDLKALLARATDEDTRERIKEALEDTEKAQRALADVTRKAADEAAKELQNKKAPEFHSKNKMVDRNLQSLAKSYARYAKQAEKAARAGDDKGVQKAQARMKQYATRMGRASKEQDKADKMLREDTERVAMVAEERKKQYRHVKKAGERQKRQTDAQARQANQPGQVPAADPKAAQEAIQGQQAALNEANTQLGQLIQAAGNVAGGAENIAAACREAIKAMNARQKNLEKELELIRKEVNA